MKLALESIILTGALLMGIVSHVRAEVATQPPTSTIQGTTAKTPIRLKSYLKIDDQDRITLAQIVDRNSVSPQIYKIMEGVSLGSAPGVGEQTVFSSKVLAEAMRSDAALSKVFAIIPSKLTVENRGFEFTEDAVKTELLEKWKTACLECELSIKRMGLPVLPAELKNHAWSVEADSQLPKGHFNVKLFVKRDNGTEALYWVNGQVEVRKLVPVLTRSLMSGVRLENEDFKWEWRDITMASDGFPNENAIVGQKLRLSTQAGSILYFQNLAREKAIQRGEIVRAIVGEGTWQVSLEAITETDGYIGDIINLKNRQSNKLLSGEVVARGEVKIR